MKKWIPISLAVLLVLILSLFAADAIGEGILAVLVHLIPVGVIAGLLALGWYRPRAGIIAFTGLAAALVITSIVGHHLGWILAIPSFGFAVFFWFRNHKLQSAQPNRAPMPAKGITITKRALQLCFLLSTGLVLSACKPEAKVATGSDPSGVYALVSVNGNKVPASVSHDGTSLQVRSGTFTIKADGTCSTKTVFVPPSGSEATREVSATYTKEGSKLTMQWQGAGTTTGTIEGSAFTMDNEGMVFVYRK
jgi:hypothetical protein